MSAGSFHNGDFARLGWGQTARSGVPSAAVLRITHRSDHGGRLVPVVWEVKRS